MEQETERVHRRAGITSLFHSGPGSVFSRRNERCSPTVHFRSPLRRGELPPAFHQAAEQRGVLAEEDPPSRSAMARRLASNRTRDRIVNRTLRRTGWRLLRIWEHELARKNEARLLSRIRRALGPGD